MPREKVLCIYCKEDKLSSKEHVVQKALGGNLTLKFVCEDCNGSFSGIDQSLAENSVVSLSRVIEQAHEGNVKLGGDSFWTDTSGISREIEIRGGLKPFLKPQVGFIENGEKLELSICCGSQEDTLKLFRSILRYVISDEWNNIFIKKCEKRSEGFIPSLVSHRRDEVVFRPTDDINPRDFIERLKKSLTQDRLENILKELARPENSKQQSHDKPSVVVMLSYHFDSILRAVAKSMFNILADSQGKDFVLKPEFDHIRNYIRGSDIRPTSLGEDGIAYDRRFVTMIGQDEKTGFLQILKDEKKHVAMLYNHYPYLIGVMNFFGSNAYIVNFGELSSSKELFEFYVFDSVARRHDRKDKYRFVSDYLRKKNSN